MGTTDSRACDCVEVYLQSSGQRVFKMTFHHSMSFKQIVLVGQETQRALLLLTGVTHKAVVCKCLADSSGAAPGERKRGVCQRGFYLLKLQLSTTKVLEFCIEFQIKVLLRPGVWINLHDAQVQVRAPHTVVIVIHAYSSGVCRWRQENPEFKVILKLHRELVASLHKIGVQSRWYRG